jgi:hypothetical protein
VDVLLPADPQVRAVAREVVADLAADWHRETGAPARPGENCRTCEVASWCPSAMLDVPTVRAGGSDATKEPIPC